MLFWSTARTRQKAYMKKDLTCSICGEEIIGVLVEVGEAEDWICEQCAGVSKWDFISIEG
jgi:hypothetical protein